MCFLIYRNTYFSGTTTLVSDLVRYLCGVCVIIGHIFPVTNKFKGGKGIASTLGLFWFGLACDWVWFALIIFGLLWGVVLFIFLTEWGSLGSLFGVTAFSVIQVSIFLNRYGVGNFNAYLVCTYLLLLAINVLTWGAHHVNVVRLFAGEEHHTSIRKLAKKKKKA
jgi:glycerol-3-phosphate acyltransferase PlsY